MLNLSPVEFSDINNETLDDALSRMNVLIIEDQLLNIHLLEAILSTHFMTQVAMSGEEAIECCQNTTPDLILLDIQMGGIDGIETCKHLKSLPHIKDTPVIFITSFFEHEDFCWEVGGVDFIRKPFTNKTVFNRVKAHLTLKMQRDRLLELVFLDSLTEIYNRRYFDIHYEKIDLNAKRDKSDYALIVIDIDLFKQFNDIYGHLEGDSALKIVAQTIKDTLKRPQDFVARYGGEEFAVVLPYTDLKGAILVTENIIKNIAALNIVNSASSFKHLSVSAGIATLKSSEDHVDTFQIADDKLYMSKQSGRNKFSY
ncbi:diguanylate cyclase [Pseudoalteromonas sp. FUC4]|uniref:GGDEF domain-containing response regulator n=1 Tax=Pseudoalteromonas sp. FUC4 TaxID=2511201 RepID=UPI0021CE5B3C|nr:diguanylate cyclase [Pseudoalteromonas sp. FUC4]